MASKATQGKKSTQRKLTAILCADVHGYSRLMGADEEATLETLTAYRKVFTSKIKKHRGRVVDAKGDALLAEFAAVTDAVSCAVEIQRELAERNTELSDNRRMDFRIGINLGEVMVKGEEIYGDGVNVAARLESLAEPGGICISRPVYDQVKAKLELEYEYLGEQQVKNIEEPVRAYRVLSVPGAAAHTVIRARRSVAANWRIAALGVVVVLLAAGGGLLAWNAYRQPGSEQATEGSDTGSVTIAVLPFTNMSGNPEQEYFSDGITEDLITELSRFSELGVIARNSTFRYKGRAVDVKQVGSELGARYVVEGSVRKSGSRVRISAQLIDAASAKHIWAERYDRDLRDVFALQDEITQAIAAALPSVVRKSEERKALRKHPADYRAWDYYLRGRGQLTIWDYKDPEVVRKGRAYFVKALELDPNYVSALRGVGFSDLLLAKWDGKKALNNAYRLATKAQNLEPKDPRTEWLLGLLYLKLKEPEKALAAYRRGHKLNPNDPGILLSYGWALGTVGKAEQGVPLVKKAMRLNPFPPRYYYYNAAVTYLRADQYRVVIETLEPVGRPSPAELRLLIVSYIRLGNLSEARKYKDKFLEKIPDFSLSAYKARLEKRGYFRLDAYIEDLRKAGLPD